MKKFAFILLLAGFAACTSQNNTDTDTTKDESLSFYGDTIQVENAITPAELLAQSNDKDTIYAKVSTTIIETCTKKGCWMDVDLGDGSSMTVRFKDYGFFVPKEGVEGYKTVFEGIAYYDTLSVETLQHYAFDAGKDSTEINAITEPKAVLTFEASGVTISQN